MLLAHATSRGLPHQISTSDERNGACSFAIQQRIKDAEPVPALSRHFPYSSIQRRKPDGKFRRKIATYGRGYHGHCRTNLSAYRTRTTPRAPAPRFAFALRRRFSFAIADGGGRRTGPHRTGNIRDLRELPRHD